MIADVEVELNRVVDRLSTMPLAKAELSVTVTHRTAAFILDQTRAIDSTIPSSADLPVVGVSASAAQLSVIGQDYLNAARQASDVDVSEVLNALVELRRSLP